MSSNFKIGTLAGGVNGMTALDALTTPIRNDPQYFFGYPKRVALGNGGYRWVGAPVTEWQFPLLTLAQRNQLATYCSGASAIVYIRTPKLNATFANWLAVMSLPESEPPIKGGLIKGFVVRFEQMEEQV